MAIIRFIICESISSALRFDAAISKLSLNVAGWIGKAA
jgi:hypothetical protein